MRKRWVLDASIHHDVGSRIRHVDVGSRTRHVDVGSRTRHVDVGSRIRHVDVVGCGGGYAIRGCVVLSAH